MNITYRSKSDKSGDSVEIKSPRILFPPCRGITLKSSQGIVNADSLDGMSDEEIRFAVAGQIVSGAYGLIEKRENKPVPLHAIFSTF